MTLLGKLRLYLQTAGYLRRDQLAQMVYRRIVRRTSKPHRALDRAQIRDSGPVDFHSSSETKALDRLVFDDKDGSADERFDWRTNGLWQPLRYQPHYFDYLLDSSRSQAWKRTIITDWIVSNPRDKGDGWIAYAVSLRIVNWIKFFTETSSKAIEEIWMDSLYGHALWLENNLELHILANHYLKNAKALVFAGVYFTGADADRWLRRGLEIFLSELEEQFLADGGHYERSPMYHAIAVGDVLDVFSYLSTGNVAVLGGTFEKLRERAVAGLDFLSALQLPDGTLPLFNDAASDVGPSPAELYSYAREALGYERTQPPERLTIRALEASGYFLIREGASMLVIDCGPIGPQYQPGHGHCDCLSYELSLAGVRVVVDSGVFDYENNAARRYARSTEAHNTLRIDGAQQSDMWDVFRVAHRAYPKLPSLTLIGPRQAEFSGAHDGFARSPAKAVHHRTVRYERGDWAFEDSIVGSGRHLIESRVHLHPSLCVQQAGDVISIADSKGQPLAELRSTHPSMVRVDSAPHYPRFGSAESGRVVVMTLESTLPATLSYTIVPHGATSARLS